MRHYPEEPSKLGATDLLFSFLISHFLFSAEQRSPTLLEPSSPRHPSPGARNRDATRHYKGRLRLKNLSESEAHGRAALPRRAQQAGRYKTLLIFLFDPRKQLTL